MTKLLSSLALAFLASTAVAVPAMAESDSFDSFDSSYQLLRLRDAYRERAGASFRPRVFHDELLAYGGLPVALARWGMELGDE